MSRYPDHRTYRALYARFIEGRDVGELLELLQPLQGTRLLDLCCGEGVLTKQAIQDGASHAVMVDRERAMMSTEICKHPRVRTIIRSARDALHHVLAYHEAFDRIACRQAVNYWLNEETAGLVAEALVDGGVFVFNTFNQKPPDRPHVLQYERDGHTFVEVSWLAGETVHHVQVRDWLAPHTTSFAWMPPERFRALLQPYFTVRELRKGKTSLYRCEKK